MTVALAGPVRTMCARIHTACGEASGLQTAASRPASAKHGNPDAYQGLAVRGHDREASSEQRRLLNLSLDPKCLSQNSYGCHASILRRGVYFKRHIARRTCQISQSNSISSIFDFKYFRDHSCSVNAFQCKQIRNQYFWRSKPVEITHLEIETF